MEFALGKERTDLIWKIFCTITFLKLFFITERMYSSLHILSNATSANKRHYSQRKKYFLLVSRKRHMNYPFEENGDMIAFEKCFSSKKIHYFSWDGHPFFTNIFACRRPLSLSTLTYSSASPWLKHPSPTSSTDRAYMDNLHIC